MRFHADLHVHSKYSRATSRDLDLEHLAAWACRKGIGVVGTGDFTHPAWCAELKSKLVPAEPGLFRLRDDIAQAVAQTLPSACRADVRFMLEVEISTIYKKGERTRKIHHLIYAPDFDTVDRMSARLARIGNIASDGRPILGLDSRDLLEIALESGPDAYLVPAHIWTPWFAALGSQSGFDSIVECYGDLADRIFAVETGLSSDPPMNWRVSFLDRYRLTSNSDAHSPGKLGREATTFDCERDYFAIKRALETGAGYVGTVEFFPDEGKYHLDGHRKCEVRLTPKQTLAHDGRCPVCGQALTIGVEHRVEVLADRSEQEALPPATAGAVANLVPLPEILSELTGSGVATRTVEASYDQVVARLGPELSILQEVPVEDVARAGSSLLGEAIARLRAGNVIREPGYDGEYGVIRLFEEAELKRLTAGGLLFDSPVAKRKSKEKVQPQSEPDPVVIAPKRPQLRLITNESKPNEPRLAPADLLSELDGDQRAAVETANGALLIVAGPGSGKTRTLTHRVAHLIAEHGVAPPSCLAITFTRRAAAEMRDRLARLLPDRADAIAIHTFHSLGLAILREHGSAVGLHRGFRVASEAERVALLIAALEVSESRAERLIRAISKEKRTQCWAGAEAAEAIAAYGRMLGERNLVDFDDLIALAVRALLTDAAAAARCRERWRFISVDEFQDVDEQQYRLMTLLAPPDGNVCVIGDPDQAIYGFRGADACCFDRFRQDFPSTKVVRLARNYRSSGTIVTASAQLITARSEPIAEVVRDMHERIAVHTAPTEGAEAEAVVKTIEQLIGGHTFFSIDSGRGNGAGEQALSFADVAVLYRTDAQSAALCEALGRSGIPYKKGSHTLLADGPAVRALLDELEAGAAGATDVADDLAAAAERLGAPGAAGDDAAAALQRLTAIAATCGSDRARFLDAVALATDVEFFDPRADRVSLLTLHAAKGLEFPVVFIVGLEEGVLPLYWSEPEESVLAEERRLFYVGMTRARDRLILSRAERRMWRGKLRRLEPSPFLRDIEAELTRHQRMEPVRKKLPDRQLKLF
jgi:DNA helicase-2/ATP-dependent DNA helicase PcrA